MLIVEYDGTNFSGFQKQANARTVQDVLERAIEKVVKHPVKLQFSGRTDGGVHAVYQVVKFVTSSRMPINSFIPAINSHLPDDVVVKIAREVGCDFHPRYKAKSRVYRYLIDNGKCPSVLMRKYTWHIPNYLNVDAMQEAANYLIGIHDFRSFHASGSNLGSTVRQIFGIKCARRGRFVSITIEANAFLYHMARIIVGTLVEVGLGRIKPLDVKYILEARDRKAAGPTAPAKGLCLVKVKF
ncbi:MAG: tRNA pseudouridine(38-40) synthase TruA [Armatimonadota bacterium]|nr:tRNA pseudouridine(38-40) synthase TruA [Armatimonadota bacterium]